MVFSASFSRRHTASRLSTYDQVPTGLQARKDHSLTSGKSMSQATKRIILVVRRNQPELYGLMRERYHDVALVILDRRLSERRRQRLTVERDRRRRDRRQRWTAEAVRDWDRLGYRLLYRADGAQRDPTTNPPSR
jgi:hypothetical protein